MTPGARITAALAALFLTFVVSGPLAAGPFDPNAGSQDGLVFTDVQSLVTYINTYDGHAEQLRIAISDDLQDPAGANMQTVENAIKANGYWPGGFAQFQGYRVYIYRAFHS